MKVDFTVLKRQFEKHQEEYEQATIRALRSGWYVLGNEVQTFEENYAKMNGVNHCIGVGNGLDALRLAVEALGIGAGDEVIIQANTFIATALAVSVCGATPVFVEADRYYGVNTNSIEKAISQKTKAIIVVHLYGQMCDMEATIRIAKAHNLFVIEDCAQAHFATQNGRFAGTIGDIGCFSFYPTKTVAAFGDAGAVLCNDPEIAEKIRKLHNYGSTVKYHHDLKGINSRMDEIQAAIVGVNLKYADDGNQERAKIAERYLTGICNQNVILPEIRPGNTHVWYAFVIRCSKRSELQEYMQKAGIQTQIHYPIPCHLAKCYEELGYKKGDISFAENIAEEVLSLPIYTGMPMEEVNYIVDTINEFRYND